MGRLFRSVAVISATFSIVQGLVWTILAILALLTYTCSLYQEQNPAGYYKDFLNSYFQGSSCGNSNLFQCLDDVTEPETLVIWTSIILAANVLLVITALILISVIVTMTSRKVLVWLYSYLFFCLFVIVMDVGFTSVISKDTTAAMNSDCIPYNQVGALTLLSLAIITSKGVILWLANICFFVFLSIYGLKALKSRTSLTIKSSTTNSDISEFTVSRKMEWDNPIKVVDSGGTPVPVPEHSALRRWPYLVFSSRLAPLSKSEGQLAEPSTDLWTRPTQSLQTFQQDTPAVESPPATPGWTPPPTTPGWTPPPATPSGTPPPVVPPPLRMPPPQVAQPPRPASVQPMWAASRQARQFRPDSLEQAIRTIPLRHTNSPYVTELNRNV